jgi:PAS domain S-box-containing protein
LFLCLLIIEAYAVPAFFDSELPTGKPKVKSARARCENSDQYTKRLALAEELAHFGSWEWDVTQPRAVWSSELFRIFGIEPRVDGLTLEEYKSYIHPDDLAEINKRIESSLSKTILNQKEEIDYRIIRRDGSIRVIHSQRQVREVTEDGKLKVIVGVDQDVTEQKQAEEALKRSEEHFRAVAEAADVMVYETDVKTGKIKTLRGTEELLGFKNDEVDYSVDWVLSQMHPDDIAQVIATLKAAVNDPKIDRYVLEYRFRHKNGNYIIVKDTAKAVKDHTGKTVFFIGGVRDITQRKLDHEKIERYSKNLEKLVKERTNQLLAYERLAAIGQVTGMVGHDIRNPLHALIGEVYLIKAELACLPQTEAQKNIKESLDSIEQGIGYINKIVTDLQDYSRQLNPEIRSVTLTDLIAEVFQAIAVPHNIKLSFRIKAFSKVKLDPTFTRRALTNLINNAIQAMPDGGQLEIAGYQEKDNLYITKQTPVEGYRKK